MNKHRNIRPFLAAGILMLSLHSFTCVNGAGIFTEAVPDKGRDGNSTISLAMTDKATGKAVPGGRLRLYQVADLVQDEENGTFSYVLKEEFTPCEELEVVGDTVEIESSVLKEYAKSLAELEAENAEEEEKEDSVAESAEEAAESDASAESTASEAADSTALTESFAPDAPESIAEAESFAPDAPESIAEVESFTPDAPEPIAEADSAEADASDPAASAKEPEAAPEEEFPELTPAEIKTLTAKYLDLYVKTNGVSGKDPTVAELGEVSWSKLPFGIYLILELEPIEGYWDMTPFLMTIPEAEYDEEGSFTSYEYDVDAVPKMDKIHTPVIY